jgi:hypothetical protein
MTFETDEESTYLKYPFSLPRVELRKNRVHKKRDVGGDRVVL